MKKGIFLLLAAIVAGYLYFGFPLPSSHTNDTRFAYVFAKEGLGSADCVGYWKRAKEDLAIPLSEDPTGPPAQLTIGRFDSDEVGKVATKLAAGEFEVVMPEISGIEVKGIDDAGDCGSGISPIIEVDNVAIIRFRSPGGAFGVHVFHRDLFGWRAIERVQLGWW